MRFNSCPLHSPHLLCIICSAVLLIPILESVCPLKPVPLAVSTNLLDHRRTPCLTFEELPDCFPFSFLPSRVWTFQSLLILAMWTCLIVVTISPRGFQRGYSWAFWLIFSKWLVMLNGFHVSTGFLYIYSSRESPLYLNEPIVVAYPSLRW